MENKVKFADLSGWLKFAIVWTYISVGASVVSAVIMAIITAGIIAQG